MSISDHFLNKRRRKGPNLLFLKPWKAGVFQHRRDTAALNSSSSSTCKAGLSTTQFYVPKTHHFYYPFLGKQSAGSRCNSNNRFNNDF